MIRITSFDPSFRNFGICRSVIDSSGDLNTHRIEELYLITTEKKAGKEVRKNSDNLRRACELQKAMIKAVEGAHVVISEIPTGSQSAAASHQLGIVTGILASCPVSLIQVQPDEVKLASVGKKTASKQEMIDWAVALYPNATWLRRKHKGEMKLIDANEHLADAVASIHAGVQSDQFQQLLRMMQSFQHNLHVAAG